LRQWTEELAAQLRALGVRTYPTETYFFLADFAPHDAAMLAERLKVQNILAKPLNDRRLGSGYLRVTTALPEDNVQFVAALKSLL
jgi:histidinol-phosphate aminotransferase